MEEAEISFPMDISGETIEEILSCREYSRTKKAEELAKAFQIDVKDKKEDRICKSCLWIESGCETFVWRYCCG